MRQIEFLAPAAEEYSYWQKHNQTIIKKIDNLLEDIQRDPFNGIGEPEPLKYNWAGCWSRRITKEHRLVHEVIGDLVVIHRCRLHYK
jgi:toxin YoeB